MNSLSLLTDDPIVVGEAREFLTHTSIAFQRFFVELVYANRWVANQVWSDGLSDNLKASFATKAAVAVMHHVPEEKRLLEMDFHPMLSKSSVQNHAALLRDFDRIAEQLQIAMDHFGDKCHQFIFNIANREFLPHHYQPFEMAWNYACRLALTYLNHKPEMILVNAPSCSAFALGSFSISRTTPALIGVHSGLLAFYELFTHLTIHPNDDAPPSHDTFAVAAAITAPLLGFVVREKTQKLADHLKTKRELSANEKQKIENSFVRCLTLIFLHEIGHVRYGHLDSMLDLRSKGKAVSSDLSQQWELDADGFAVDLLAKVWSPEIWLYNVFPGWAMLSYAEEWFVTRNPSSSHPRISARIIAMIDRLIGLGTGSLSEFAMLRSVFERIQSMPLPDFQITIHQWAYLKDEDQLWTPAKKL